MANHALLPLALAALTACASAAPATGVVPVYREPMHRLVYESPLVRILDVSIPPGDTTAYHVHADRLVGVAVREARVWYQVPGAPPGAIPPAKPVPYVFDNWSPALPYTHRVANVDTVPLHYVVAEWLGRTGPEAAALPDGSGRRLLQEGPTARVYELTLDPAAATAPHTHGGPGLVVLGSEGALMEEGTVAARGGSGAGSWSWREAAGSHVVRNGGPSRLVIYEIDWR